MYCIYGKNKVGQAVAKLCEYQNIPYEMIDDSDAVTSFEKYDVIIPSPGIPGMHRIYATGKILAELDFAYQFLPKKFEIVSITGTDGKSTTSWIAYNILQKEFFGKKSVYLSGNFDIPFSATVREILESGEKKGIIVVEMSSFMTYAIRTFQSTYTIFTNLKSDHLNWHRDLQEYIDAKMNLVKHTVKKSILNAQILEFAREKGLNVELPENVRIFAPVIARNEAIQETIGNHNFFAGSPHSVRDDNTQDRTNGEDIIISGRKKYILSETHFTGFHNAMNLLSVGLLANEMRICSKRMKMYFSEITGLSHRLEKIGEKNGIIFVEDSKSTSSQSLEAALGSYGETKNLLLIVGGSDKGDSFGHLAPKFHERVKAMACIGATKEQFIHIAEQENIPYIATDSMLDAVNWLYAGGEKNDVLMISPGCASFGLFRDYLDRANQFREAIKYLP
ncbi:MAG: UDP-N-acetylmuramoyl-L-alanine--D-glutamate ligase [Candidatus Gracilibacteria bacterium]|nr:UDP-N-acetylmuramoyl-L-alanine--D-glutamate ligase [Candidatus Gracilibacteria bacterium]